MGGSDDKKQFREKVRILERALGILSDSEMSCCGVTLAQCHAIVEIGRAKVISLNALSELLNLDNSTMSRTVNNLVIRRMAKRELDAEDRRYVTIALTENGMKVFEGIENGMELYFSSLYEDIPENKRSQVLESLDIIIHAMDTVKCC